MGPAVRVAPVVLAGPTAARRKAKDRAVRRRDPIGSAVISRPVMATDAPLVHRAAIVRARAMMAAGMINSAATVLHPHKEIADKAPAADKVSPAPSIAAAIVVKLAAAIGIVSQAPLNKACATCAMRPRAMHRTRRSSKNSKRCEKRGPTRRRNSPRPSRI